ncbi:MAG: bifunctional ADP-dependent NAD(P)H-hydrate dehydratase/NAD(P)H-hydrate epimerase [Nitrospira sp. LK265]|nr:NAD(P)H-hydrate dehydratase [Nitrospira sp.]NGZ59350.1 bifunctional ADP-dependent NAD(P)H-hydrate dehydratase/NAD(P)H-hydrate epimerase [Nitrospira sp. LK265]
MTKIITAAQMQDLDRRTISEAHIPATTLMERAGSGVASCLEQRLGPLRGKTVTVVCGKGNNGGDGFVAARLLRRRHANVHVLAMTPITDLSRDAATMYKQFVRGAGKSSVRLFTSKSQIQVLLQDSDILIDALLGTGLSSAVTGRYAEAIDSINETDRPVVAVDLPSGLHADTGMILGRAVRASLTVTFGLPKLGLYQNCGIDLAGEVAVVDIGIPPAYIDSVESRTTLITEHEVRTYLPRRQPSSHKGTFGHVGIIAGSVGKTGAAAMAARAALRVGAGLVTVAVPTSVNDILEAKLLEVMTVPMPETKARTFARTSLDRLVAFMTARTAIAIGPGLSTHPETVELVQGLTKQLDRPAVLDADALNALTGRTAILASCKTPPIITPHPGEMARLEADATPQTVNSDRIGTASRFARERGLFVVLKGARTVVARPDGAVAICPTGNPGMATAGTGDVLTGMVVGLLAQGLPSWEAACAATYLHGAAGDLAAARNGQAGLIAGDVIEEIPNALKLTGQASAKNKSNEMWNALM